MDRTFVNESHDSNTCFILRMKLEINLVFRDYQPFTHFIYTIILSDFLQYSQANRHIP